MYFYTSRRTTKYFSRLSLFYARIAKMLTKIWVYRNVDSLQGQPTLYLFLFKSYGRCKLSLVAEGFLLFWYLHIPKKVCTFWSYLWSAITMQTKLTQVDFSQDLINNKSKTFKKVQSKKLVLWLFCSIISTGRWKK